MTIRNRSSLLVVLLSAVLASACADTPPHFIRVTATPQVVPGGGLVQVSAEATDPNGDALKYTWTASSGWTIKSGGDGAAVVQAPAKAGAQGLVTVTVDDGHGGTAKASVGVATDDTSPMISEVTATPSPAVRGMPVTLAAAASDPDGDALTYAWSIAAGPAGSTATLSSKTTASPQFTPDMVGTYTIELVVTDSPGGHASVPYDLQLEAVNGTPTAMIAGTAPLAGVMNTDLTLDGSGSTSPAGDPLSYAWAVTNGPAGATATATPVGDSGKANFKADTAGNYTVALTVTDPWGNTGTAATTVAVAGPATLKIASGNNQSGAVYGDLAKPLAVEAVTSGGKPVPGVPVTWIPAGATLKTAASTTTDASGLADVVVRMSRIAGTASVMARVPGMPSLTASFDLTAVPGPVTSINVSMTTGDADTGAMVSVTPVDQFGNPSTADLVANAQAFQLNASGNAVFASSATTGTLTAGGGTNQVQGELAQGAFNIALTDTTAEAVTVKIQSIPGQGAYLPYTAWAEDFEDDAETGMGAWTTGQNNAPSWQVETGASLSHTGSQALGIDLTPADTDLYGASVMTYQLAPTASNMIKLEYWQNLAVSSAADAANGCTAQPDFYLAARSCDGLGCAEELLTPRSGYPVTDSCSGRLGFTTTAATTGWVAKVVDVTDAMGAGNQYLDFEMANTPDPTTPVAASDWHVDDVRIVHLTDPGNTGTTNTIIRPGVPAEVDWTASTYNQPTVLLGQCINGVSALTVGAKIVDANGNLTRESQAIVDFNWTGSAVAVQGTTGTVVTVGSSDAEMQFNQGQAALVLSDSTTEAVTLSLVDTRNTKLTMGPNATANFAGTFVCHDNGIGNQWSDNVALGTYDAQEAVRACDAHYGAGRCTTNNTYHSTYYAGRIPACPSRAYQWFFANYGHTDVCTRNATGLSQGYVYWTGWIPSGSFITNIFCQRFCEGANPGSTFATRNPARWR